MEFNEDELEEDLKKEEEEEEKNSQDIKSEKKRSRFKKLKTTLLSSFPDLISLDENNKAEEIEEKKGFR